MQIPNKVLERYSREFKKDMEYTEIVFNELEHFLDACAMDDKNYIPSAIVDDAWHTFILFTKIYGEWCLAKYGKIIHHQPLDIGPIEGVSPKEYWEGLDTLRKKWPLKEPVWQVGAWSHSGDCEM